MLAISKRFKEALAACSKAIHLNPNDAQSYFFKGVILIELKRFQRALNASEHAIRLDPKNAAAYTNKGVVLAELGRYQEAIIASEQAIHLDPNDPGAHDLKKMISSQIQYYNILLSKIEQDIIFGCHIDCCVAMWRRKKANWLKKNAMPSSMCFWPCNRGGRGVGDGFSLRRPRAARSFCACIHHREESALKN